MRILKHTSPDIDKVGFDGEEYEPIGKTKESGHPVFLLPDHAAEQLVGFPHWEIPNEELDEDASKALSAVQEKEENERVDREAELRRVRQAHYARLKETNEDELSPDDREYVAQYERERAAESAGVEATGEVKATEAAVEHANRHGVALSEVEGTGKDGAITKKDVQAHVSAQGGTSEDDDDESDEDDESESDEEDETEE